ncbi:hypothetical protein DFJ74DRAFT_770828 [Hyaloraphidium curvatum]|nr:hypothetical protein DFJ74DRAFT_770828 [Hyaloraphidium curvatum]
MYLALALLVGLLPAALATNSNPPPAALRTGVVCNNKFALCNMAPCKVVPSAPLMLNYAAPTALCECSVLSTWNIGPGQCTDRDPKRMPDGRTYILSTFSNAFNNEAKALWCGGANAGPWTNCYGAPCAIDSTNSSKAYCTCTMQPSSNFDTFAGGCDRANCKKLWSASTPGLTVAGSKFLDQETRKQDPNYSGPGPASPCR